MVVWVVVVVLEVSGVWLDGDVLEGEVLDGELLDGELVCGYPLLDCELEVDDGEVLLVGAELDEPADDPV